MIDKQSMPSWVRRSLIAAGVVVALVFAAMASGHGPWRHFQHAMTEGAMP